jgi:protein TonB
MESQKSDDTLTRKSIVIFCTGVLIISVVVAIALKNRPDYSFISSDTSMSDTSKSSAPVDENIFPEAPVLPSPKNQVARKKTQQEQPILPEIILEDPVEETENANVVHPKISADVFTTVDVDAVPPKGTSDFHDFIKQKIKYPVQATRMKIEGIVVVEFIVGSDGAVREVKSVKGIGAGCDEEAVRIISSSRRWSPALIDDKPVAQRRSVNVDFKLDRRSRKNN